MSKDIYDNIRTKLTDSKYALSLKKHIPDLGDLSDENNLLSKYELYKLYKYMVELQDHYIGDNIQIPFDIKYIIGKYKEKGKYEIIKRSDVILSLIIFCKSLGLIYGRKDIYDYRLKLIKIILWQELSSNYVCNKYKFSKNVFNKILSEIENKLIRSIVNPGEAIGVLTATSIASILTQLTLNTFHLAGVGTKGKVIQNMTTFRDLLNCTKNPNVKSVYIRIYFPEKVKRDEKYIRDVIKSFNLNYIYDFISEKSIIDDDNFFSGKTIYGEDIKYLKVYLKHNGSFKSLSNNSIRVKFNRVKLHSKKISLEDIVLGITDKFPEANIIPLGETVIRIYVQMLYVTDIEKNELDILKKIYDTLDSIKLTGIDGINGVQFNEIRTRRYDVDTRKELSESEYILYTNGINLYEVLMLPYIDHLRTISNEVNEVAEILGIEAGRRVLMENLYSVILNNSANINRHFLHLLVDFMTHTGSFVPINIYGINKVPRIEPLQKITFERPENGFINASIRGSLDTMGSMGANVITCQQGKYGKGLFDVLMDNK